MRRLVTFIAVGVLLVTAVSAFAQGGTADTAMVRVAHFVPGTGEVDVYINGELSDVQALDFGDITGWFEMAPGAYDLAVTLAGDPIEEAVITLSGVSLAAGDWVTVAAVGSVETGTAFLQPIFEDYSEITFGETRLTVFHGIPNADPINVQLSDGLVLIQTLAFPQTLGENDGAVSVDLIAGPRTIQFTPFDDPATVLLEINVMLASGKNNFVALTGLISDPVVVVVPTDPADLTAVSAEEEVVETGEGPLQARVAHLAPGAGEVDVYVNGELTLSNVLFGDITEWSEMPAGFYDIAFTPTGASVDEAVIEGQVALIAGEWITITAYGSAELGMGKVEAVVENFSSLPAGESRVALFHAIPNAGPLNLQLNDGTVLIQTVGFPGTLDDNAGYASVDIVAGPRVFQITPYNDPTTVLFELAVPMNAGENYYIAVAGLAGQAVTMQTHTPVTE